MNELHTMSSIGYVFTGAVVVIWLAVAGVLFYLRQRRPSSFSKLEAQAERNPWLGVALVFFGVRFDRTYGQPMPAPVRRPFRKEDRRVGEPVLTLWPGCKQTWVLKVDTSGPNTTYEQELLSLPLAGFGQCLFHDYYELACAVAVDYIQRNGLVLSSDRSTIAGVDMVVFRR